MLAIVTRARRRELIQRRGGDLVVLVGLIVVPFAVLVPLALAGHVLLPGDDLLQNFPLRELAGKLIANGRLPIWDPYIWSGSPLLGGWNAGALYPGTWLFAFIPSVAAWTINLAAVPIVASTGLYCFCRRALGQRPLAALGAALIFTYTGVMLGQVVHLGLEQGCAVVPFMLLALFESAQATSRRARLGAGLLFGVAVALCILAGDPRAITDAGLVVSIYLLALLYRSRHRRLRIVFDTLAGGILGALIGAAQWLPGLNYLGSSQRQSAAFYFYGAGSLSPLHEIADFTLPYLAGGSGNLGLPVYQGTFNIPELTVGVGLVALVATGAFVPELFLCAYRAIRLRPSPAVHELGVWFALVVSGLLLATGDTTPLGHLFFHVPLFSGERLQNRNLFLADLGFAVLAGSYLDDLLRARTGEPRADQRLPRTVRRDALPARLLGLLPSAAIGALLVYAIARPNSLETSLDFPEPVARFFHDQLGYLGASALVAMTVAGAVFFQRRLGARRFLLVVAALVAVDVTTYMLNNGWQTVPTSLVNSRSALSTSIGELVGPQGRYAVIDPDLIAPNGNVQTLDAAGIPDVNIIEGLRSVQGYGSIVDGDYEDATGTHALAFVAPDRLSTETFNTLNLRVLLTLPIFVAEPLAQAATIPIMGTSSADVPVPTTTNPGPPPHAAGPWAIAPGAAVQYFLPGAAEVLRATVLTTTPVNSPLRIELGTSSGTRASAAVNLRSGRFFGPVPAVLGATILTLVNSGHTTITVGAVVVSTNHPRNRLLLSGALEGGLTAPQWSYAGALGPFLVYKNTESIGLGWLQPLSSHSPEVTKLAPGSVQTQRTSALQTADFVVDSRTAARLVRSETYEPGWTATLTSLTTGRVTHQVASRFGLVQSVVVEPGRYRVTWSYDPRSLRTGLAMTAAGTAAVLLALVALARGARRRRRRARLRTFARPARP